MNELHIMALALIACGLYISYQYSVIQKYRHMLTLATYTLYAAYDHIKGADAMSEYGFDVEPDDEV